MEFLVIQQCIKSVAHSKYYSDVVRIENSLSFIARKVEAEDEYSALEFFMEKTKGEFLDFTKVAPNIFPLNKVIYYKVEKKDE
jgi:hypothetical protein